MTDISEVALAVSLTHVNKWGSDVQVLLAIAAEPGPAKVLSYANLAQRTGLSTGTISVSLRRLETRRVILRDPGLGRDSATYFIRPPAKWGLVPWRVSRGTALERLQALSDHLYRAQMEMVDLASSRVLSREQTRSEGARAKTRDLGSSRDRTREQRAVDNTVCSRDRTRDQTGSPLLTNYSLQRVTRSELEGGRELRSDLSGREVQLIGAFLKGACLEYVEGRPLLRLKRVATESNGNFEKVLEAAGDLAGPGLFEMRLAQLERLMVEPSTHPAPYRQLGEKEALERQIEILSKMAGCEDEIEELRLKFEELS